MFEVYKVRSVRVLCAVRSLCSYLVTCPQVRRTQTRRTSTYNTEPSSPLPSPPLSSLHLTMDHQPKTLQSFLKSWS